MCSVAHNYALRPSLGLIAKQRGRLQPENGPYMRRFLDGFYPMRVSMTVKLDTGKLRIIDSAPGDQPGFTVRLQGNEVGYDTVFEGILTTVLRFDCVQP